MSEGSAETPYADLSPEVILDALEAVGFAPTGGLLELNSYENRVFQLELEDGSFVVAKFYRPGRWSAEQIGEEHGLLAELAAAELPVCAVRPFPDGTTLRTTDGIHYAIWDRRGGRAPDELDPSLALRLGMFVGRMHNVAAAKSFRRRPRLDAETYVAGEAAWLERERLVPAAFAARYLRACFELAELAESALAGAETLRLHADLHLGNVLLRDGELRVLDFDDAATGPPVQDLWLAISGRDARSLQLRDYFLDGYERFRRFDRGSLRLVELLRGMRMVRYAAWLARRWDDPAFRAGWPDFGGEDYWRTTTADLEEQLGFAVAGLRSAPEQAPAGSGGGLASPAEDAAELTNKDYFWDWEGD